MDDATSNFYRINAERQASLYESFASPVAGYFAAAFPPGATVLDIGAGSGRDLALLLSAGYDAFGTEPSDPLRARAIELHPELTDRLTSGALPDIGQPFGRTFDGVLCSAVLMHVPEPELFDSAFALRRLLQQHGRLLVSLPLSRGDVLADERGADGRLFKSYAPGYVQLLFEHLGFQQIGRWDMDDMLGRAGTRWYTLLFEL